MPLLTTLTALAIVGLAWTPAAARAQQAPVAPLKIVAFGDSLTSGHRLGAKDAYPAILNDILHEQGLPFAVVNHGVSGDTTSRALRRLQAALDERPQILIVALGANDGLGGIAVPQVRRNLEQIIEAAQAQSIKVLLVGMEALPVHGWQYTLDFHQIFPQLAAKYGVPLVPFMLTGVIGNPDLISADGVHPNAAGAKVIAANIWPHLRPLAEGVVGAAR